MNEQNVQLQVVKNLNLKTEKGRSAYLNKLEVFCRG